MTAEIHFRSHFWQFHIDTQLYFFLEIFDKKAIVGHFGCPKFTFDSISYHFRSIRNLLSPAGVIGPGTSVRLSVRHV